MLSQDIWRTYEDASRQLLKNIREQLLFDEIEEKEVGKEGWGVGWEVNIIAFRVGIEGFILAECNRWKHPPDQGGNLAKFYYTIKCSYESDKIVVTPIDLRDGANCIAKAEKITEIKVDLSSSNESFIAGMVSYVFAKVRDRIAIRNNLRIVHPEEGAEQA
jgi:hypothetical protein